MDQVYESKRLFVEKFIKPMAIAMGTGVTDVVYDADENPKGGAWETVTVYYGETVKCAIVNLDSKHAILKDLIRQEAL